MLTIKKIYSIILIFFSCILGCACKKSPDAMIDDVFFTFLNGKTGQEDLLNPALCTRPDFRSYGLFKTELLQVVCYESTAALYFKIIVPEEYLIDLNEVLHKTDGEKTSLLFIGEFESDLTPLSAKFSRLEAIDYTGSDKNLYLGLMIGINEPYCEGQYYSVNLSDYLHFNDITDDDTVAFTWRAQNVQKSYYINVDEEKCYGTVSLCPISINVRINVVSENEKIVLNGLAANEELLFSKTISDGTNKSHSLIGDNYTNEIFDLNHISFIEIAGYKYSIN